MSTGLYTQPQMPSPQPQMPQYAAPPRRARGGNLLLSLLMIGGGFLILLAVLFVAGVWYLMSSLEGLVVGLGREAIVAMVNDSEIPGQEKTEVIQQVDRAVAAYKAGEIDEHDLDRLMTDLEASPLMTYITFMGMEDHYNAQVNLPEAEQEQLRVAFRRVMAGVYAGKISEDEFFYALPHDERLQEALDESEEKGQEVIRKWIAKMTTLADEAGVPPNPPTIDAGDEAKRLVDKMLAK